MRSLRWPLACLYFLQVVGQADAQDLQFGLQITQTIPFSDLGSGALLDRALGYGVGAQVLVSFTGGHALLPTTSYQFWKGAYVQAGIQDIGNKDLRTVFFGGGLRWRDEDLKKLVGLAGAAK